MVLKIAENIGFCFGVQRAVDAVFESLDAGNRVSTLGPIIHNPQVVDYLKERGADSIDRLDEFHGDVLIIRSHGVPPEVFEEARRRKINILDATCPFVHRIQQKAILCRQNNIPLIIIGKASHPEVIGINGWYGGGAVIVENENDVHSLPNYEYACVVAQTTTSNLLWDRLIPLIKQHIDNPEIICSICNSTQTRQQEAVRLASESDGVIVIGGKNSSNTQKLFEICHEICPDTISIESAEEVSPKWVHEHDTMAIISGASTPDWILKEVFDVMNDIDNITVANETEEVAQVVEQAEEAVEEAVQPEVVAEAEEVVTEAEEAVAEAKDEADDYMQQIEETLVTIRPGQIITGKVVSVNDSEVCVNIGYKADGFISREEFSSTDINPAEVLNEGDEIEVEILKVNDGEGNVVLSKKNVDNRKFWQDIVDHYEDQRFEAEGKQAVKGGLIANIGGIRAFIPASQLDTKYVESIESYVGQKMTIKIIEVEKSRHRVVGSRKAVLIEDAEREKAEKWDKLVEGETVTGVVRRLTDFGAFVDIGGIDGLVHVTNLAWGRVQHPSDVVKIGQTIECLILKVDRENQRVSLGYRQLQPKPWDVAVDKYIVGSIVTGKVVRIVTFGAFVELEPGLDGLVHISQIADQRIEKVEDVLTIGQVVDVKVLDVNPDEHRISLSIREANAGSDSDYDSEDYADDEDHAEDDLSIDIEE